MSLLVHLLLYGFYALVAAGTGWALVQVGGAEPATAVLSGLAVFGSMAVTHAGLAAAGAAGAIGRTEKKLRADMDKLRAQQKEIIADVDAVSDRVDRLDMAVAEVAQARLQAPQAGPEIKLIETIVDKLGRAMDARLDDFRRITGAAAPQKRERSPIEMVREALDDNRVELHLQPVVALPQRRTAFYEGFSRLKDEAGRLIMPNEFIPAAEKAGLLGAIDNMLLFRCVQIVKKLAQKDRRIGIFCNLSPKALVDEAFFPQFFDFLREHREMAGAVIFEMPQAAFEARTSAEARAMGRLADLGYRFSLDKVTHFDVDLVDMERAGVRFFKAPGRLILDSLVRDGIRPRSTITREIAAADVSAVFIRYSIEIVAERIEDEETVLEVLDLEIPYAQGHLFGAPRAIKESLMEETAPPKDFMSQGRAG